MSIHALSAVKSSSFGSPTKKAIMLILADYADESGVCYPGVDRIAQEAETSPRTVQRTIKDLVTARVLIRHTRSGRNLTNIYRLNLTAFTPINYPDFTKGDNSSPLPEKVTYETERATSATLKGDAGVTLTVREPSAEPIDNTKGENAKAENTIQSPDSAPSLTDVTTAALNFHRQLPDTSRQIVGTDFISLTASAFHSYWSSTSAPWRTANGQNLATSGAWIHRLHQQLTEKITTELQTQKRYETAQSTKANTSRDPQQPRAPHSSRSGGAPRRLPEEPLIQPKIAKL